MRVQHNIASMNSYRNYNNNTKAINKNLEKLSSGYKINRAGDDAAGLAISEKMRAQITGLEGAQKNAKDGISLVQTAEGALTEVHSMLNRMYQLAEQSANGTYADSTNDAINGIDRDQLQKEVSKLRSEINRIADSSNFNGIKLLDGSLKATGSVDVSLVTAKNATGSAGLDVSSKFTFDSTITDDVKKAFMTATKNGAELSIELKSDNTTVQTLTGYTVDFAPASGLVTIKTTGTTPATIGSMTVDMTGAQAGTTKFKLTGDENGGGLQLQIGDTADSYNQMFVGIQSIKSDSTGLNIDSIDISNQTGATSAMALLKSAINTVSDVRGGLGATQNRLEHTINNLSVMQENIQDAESTIRDTDVADEMMKYTKNSILVQSAQAMLAQANQQPQGVLQLLQ